MYGLVAAALVAYTAIALIFKAAASRTRPDQLVIVALATVTLIAAVLMVVRGEWGGTWLGGALALISGALFYFASTLRARALATTPASLVFAVTNLDLVVSGAIVLFIPAFGQPVTPWHVLAILTAGGAIVLGARVRDVERIGGATFGSLALLAAAATGFVLYAHFFPGALLFFILLDHLAGVLLNGRVLRDVRRAELSWGIPLGLCMFIGFWCLLQALTMAGDQTTLVLLVLSLKTPLIALLSAVTFGERATREKLAAVALATVALLLWEIGSGSV